MFARGTVARYRSRVSQPQPKADKFRHYRARKTAQGLRAVRLWAFDVDAPGFQDMIDAETARLNASAGGDDASAFIWAAYLEHERTANDRD